MGSKNNLFLGEREYYEIFEKMPQSISIFNLKKDENNKIIDLIFKYVNPAAAHDLNIKREKIINTSFRNFYRPEITLTYLDKVNKSFKEGKSGKFEIYFTPLDKYFLVSTLFLQNNLFVAIILDITERKKAGNRIIDSEEIFRSIVQQSIDGIMIVNENGVIIEWNYSMEKITGLKRDNAVNQLVWDALYSIAPEDKKTEENYRRIKINALDFIERIDPTSLGKLFEDRIQRADGSIRFLQSLPFLIKTSKGKLICSFHRDITEHKKSEEELEKYRSQLEELVKRRTQELTKLTESLKKEIGEKEKAEEKYRELFNRANDMISLGEIEENGMPGRFIEINDVASQRLGYTKEEFLNMTPVDIVATDKRAEMPKHAEELARTGHARFEIVHVAKDGSRIPVEINNHIFKLKGKKVALAISRDISERKNAELALKESEEELKAVIESSPDSITVTDLNLNIILCNQATVKMYGASVKEEIIGLNAFNLVDPKDRPRLSEIVMEILSTNKSINLELNLQRKDNTTFPAELSGNIIKDAQGNPSQFIAITKDINERKEAERKLKETINELERSNKELQSFTYITSHDLQEPLRIIASYAGLIKHRYEGQLDKDADDFIEYMVSEASRMKSMIQGLLDYSRIGTESNEFREFNAQSALKVALSILEPLIKENNAKITYDPLPTIFADEDQMSRVFKSLIGNAIKFRKPNEAPRIHVSSKREGDEYNFSVKDNSIGIEAEYGDRIFEVFKRLHSIGEYEGAGIGLAIVKRIIDHHGGRIWVKSQYGEGSMFYFTIPIK